jgi:hypothetical protein
MLLRSRCAATAHTATNENLAHRRRSDRAKAQLQTFSSQSLQIAFPGSAWEREKLRL